jgi:large subunit ribosomal protein L24
MSAKIKKGDVVLVTTGKDKGKSGIVTSVLPKDNKVIVESINVVKISRKPSQNNPKGGIEEQARPISISNVGLINPLNKNRISRIGYKFEDKQKVRIYRQAKGQKV